MAAATGQDPSKRSQFREQTWKGTKTRTRDATLSRYSGIDLNQLNLTAQIAASHSGQVCSKRVYVQIRVWVAVVEGQVAGQ
jgi:integrin-linked kinase